MAMLQRWGAKVGVLELFGLLAGNRRIATYIELLNTLGKNSSVKSVVVSVDSPGGLATASDYLYSAVNRLASKALKRTLKRGSPSYYTSLILAFLCVQLRLPWQSSLRGG